MALWLSTAPLLLASGSATRRAMLEAAGIPVEAVPANLDERAIEEEAGAAPPGEVASLLARAKAKAVAGRIANRMVVGADQVLALGPERFSKPTDAAAARAQLKALRGRAHALHSAVAVARDETILFQHVATATLLMRDFSDDFLDTYLGQAGAAVSASVGGYQLEGIGIHLFDRIQGDHFTILGLPLLPLLGFLRGAGWLV